MWVIPNYRTDEGATEFEPLTPDQKFKLAFDDSFDPTAFLATLIQHLTGFGSLLTVSSELPSPIYVMDRRSLY
jgi:hypothetical protein